MDLNKRLLLQKHQQDIIDDLDVVYIYDELFTKNVISAEEFQHILNVNSRVEKTRFLLESLIRSGSNKSYEAFVDSLHKDYKWLWEKLAIENNNPMPNDSFEDSLSKGDVPRLPDHHVRRAKVEQIVADSLKALTRHKVLAIHGMPGSGKTCVVLSALRDNPDLVTNNFNGVVFWVNFGNCKTDDDIIFQQSKLLRKASSIYTQNSYMNSTISMSSIGSNGDSHSSSNYEWTMIDLKDKLKAQFSETPLKESLLILDEVNDKKGLEAFDIGCKILVTTRDTSVVANYHPQIIKIENSLEEKESLEIFALSLEVPVSKLPWQAKKIHEICKGSPFNIGLIGAQLAENRERLIDDPKRWNYYVKELKKKNHFSFLIKKEHGQTVEDDEKHSSKYSYWLANSMFLQHIYNYWILIKWLISTIGRDKKVAVRQGNLILAILMDIILGYIALQLLSQDKKDISIALMGVLERLINSLYSLLKWLMGAPVGLKLNNAFNKMLGKYFSYHVQLWWLFLDVSGEKLDVILHIYHYIGFLGFTFQSAIISDLIVIATFHSYCIYVYAARLFNIQISGLIALLRLFVGRKYNPLRGGIDSCEYTNQELFVGTVAFTILLLLLPTTTLYYIVFTMFRVLSLVVQYLIAKMIYMVQTLPMYVISLWLAHSPKVTGKILMEVVNQDENAPLILRIKLLNKSIPELVELFKPPVEVPNKVEWTNLLSNVLVGKQIV